MADDPYVYPGASTLRNRWDVRDAAELARREATITAARLAELAERPIPGDFDLAHLQALHRHIFGDVYDWAGEIRTVQSPKATCSRCRNTSRHTSPQCSANSLPRTTCVASTATI